MSYRNLLLVAVVLMAALGVLHYVMHAPFGYRIDLPFNTSDTTLAAEFMQSPEEVNDVLGSDHHWVEPLRRQQYIDFLFIPCYVALFTIFAWLMRNYEVPGARWAAHAAIAAAVAAGAFDVLENTSILSAIAGSSLGITGQAHVRNYALIKWGLVFAVMTIEAGVFFFWPRLGRWNRVLAILTGALFLVAGLSGLLFTSLGAVNDIEWSVRALFLAMLPCVLLLCSLGAASARRA